MKKVISAGIVIFRQTEEGIKFLILYHGRNYWNFPKGKIEGDERSWQTAFREVREETGLKSSELKLIGNFKTYEKFVYREGPDDIFKIVILYLAETTQSTIILKEYHEGYGWFTLPEAKRILAKYKYSIKILEKAYAYIKKPEELQAENAKQENPQTQPHRPHYAGSIRHPQRRNFNIQRSGHYRRHPQGLAPSGTSNEPKPELPTSPVPPSNQI
ncbi:MAG: NUDIX domain-containing protein [Candidatus Pacebacteria bacterium]|nr:NUDIX domain-containing protein [Candidatus Paceibacterota bacterium]